jgi:phenylalanyl-tRNA synthetase beta chain
MKISLNWLSDYINIPVSPEELSDILTDLGLEVEGMDKIEGVPGGLAGVKVGHVVECGKHPNADRLSLTKVDLGVGEPVQIVCGAPNVAQGQKVLVATVGTKLFPHGGEPFKIKKGKIRGEVSEGMICAEDELGIGTDHDGIMVLAEDAVIGQDAKDHLKLEEDVIYDIGLTPNRSDATSHIGVARDLLAYFKVHNLAHTGIKLPDTYNFSMEKRDFNHVTVDIKDLVGCPRYSAVSLSEVNVKESPEWIKKRLTAIGVRTINNIVDITNFVLHETGQPLHAFDLQKIAGEKVIVQNLPAGTKFTTLDEKERTLAEDDLMICNGNNEGMCIAGIFGGITSGVTETTKHIFLESAHFNAKRIRVSSTRHLLRTDAAMRFEKGTDPNETIFALKRAAQLMESEADAIISSDIIDVYPEEIKPAAIHVTYKKVNDLIGIELSRETISRILDALEIEIISTTEDSFTVQVPTNKADVTRDVDIIEEILRVYGFNNVPFSSKMTTSISFTKHPDPIAIQESLSDLLVSKGFSEMMNLSLSQSEKYKKVLPEYEDKFVYINNTSNIHLDIMRPEMMLPALQTLQYNKNRQVKDIKYFEFGRSYQGGTDRKEDKHLILILSGQLDKQSWHSKNRDTDFYDMRRVVDEIISKTGANSYKVSEIQNNTKWEYGLSYERGKDHIVSFGSIKKDVLRLSDVADDVFYAEFDLNMLYKLSSQSKTKIKPISKFPTIRRDLAMVIDNSSTFSEIEGIIIKSDKKLIKEVNLFDVYKNEEQLGAGKKSYAVSIVFEDDSKTLQDKDIDPIIKKVTKVLEEKLGASLR